MARILDAVRQAAPASPTTLARAVLEPKVGAALVPEALPVVPSERVPFVEVGGTMIEGSPDVMKGQVLSRVPAGVPEPARERGEVDAAVNFESAPWASSPRRREEGLAPEVVAFHAPGHAVSRQYQVLLDRLLAQQEEEKSTVFMLCGTESGVGTTTAILNLAVTLARRDRQVAVVDANPGRAALAQRVGLQPVPGLAEICTGQVSLSRALRESPQANLQVLTAGDDGCRAALAMRSVPGILGQLRNRFDHVFVDAPAWHDGPELTSLAAACDVLFLVVPRNRLAAQDVKELLQRLPRLGVRLGGCVVTQH